MTVLWWLWEGARPEPPTFTGLAGMIADDMALFDDTAESLGLDDDWVFD